MTIQELHRLLRAQPETALHLILPNGDRVPAHYHITEVGRVTKDFIDCGGTRRSTASCVLQAWVAQDVEHRLETGKLARIIDLAAPLLGDDELPVEIEYEGQLVSQFPLAAAEPKADGLHLFLTTKHTDCLAKESCGLVGVNEESEDSTCCATGGCC
jgi:hypothetical protein